MSGVSFDSIDWVNSTSQVRVAAVYLKDVALQEQSGGWQMLTPDIEVINESPNGWPYMSDNQKVAFVLTHGEYLESRQSTVGELSIKADIVDFVFDVPSLCTNFCIKVGTLLANKRTRAEVCGFPYAVTPPATIAKKPLH